MADQPAYEDPSGMTKTELEAEVRHLRRAAERLERTAEDAHAARQAAESRTGECEAEVRRLKTELTKESRKIDDLKATLTTLQSDRSGLAKRLEESERNEAELQRGHDRYQILLADAHDHVELERSARQEAEEKLAELKGALRAVEVLLQRAIDIDRGSAW